MKKELFNAPVLNMPIITKQTLPKSQLELTVELTVEEFKPYISRGAEEVAKQVKVEGFRPGKVPYEVLKQKIGEMTILEEAARVAINKTIGEAIKNNVAGKPAGQPQVNITKLAPNNPFEYKIVLAILPEVKLGDYKNAKVKIEKTEVAEEEVDKIIKNLMETRVKEAIVDRPIQDGDKAIIDIGMFLDKVPLDSGQAKETTVVVGENYIIPGFDKHLIGARKGEVKEFALPYPKDYHMANIAGKLVEFKAAIKSVYSRELPALDDSFAASFGAKKMEELKENIKKSLVEEKRARATQKAEIEMLEKIIAKTKFGDIPEVTIKNEGEAMAHELEHDIASRGGKFEEYLASLKKTREELKLDILPEAVKRVKTALAIRQISRAEKIEISEEEVGEKIKELLKQYKGYAKIEERVKEPGYRDYLRNVLANRKVIEKLKEWNVEK